MSSKNQRRLAAVMSADVVGYSRLMAEDELGALEAIRRHRSELFDPEVRSRGGRIVKLMGDGTLVEFPSVVQAVEAAVSIQREVAASGGPIKLRIGINLGDVIVDGDDIYGDGVNVAARLEGLGEVGGISISDDVWRHVSGRVDASFVDGGEQQVKNIPRPLRVWRWSPEGDAGDRSAGVASNSTAITEKPSIAVLPFRNQSSDPEQEYFVDGITEEVIRLLSRHRWLSVIARNSTFQFKESAADIRQIGKELSARYVLEGSVRRAGDRLRIAARLVDAQNGSYLWTETYDRVLDDIFELQDEISQQIAACLEPEIERAEWRGLDKSTRLNLGSWDLYLRGLSRMHEYSRQGNAAAKELFRQAIAIEPDFGAAHAALAYVIFHDLSDGYVDDREEAKQEALFHSEEAVRADDQDAFAHCVLGRVYSISGRIADAIQESETAIRLNPSLALAHHSLAYALVCDGQSERSIAHFETAARLSPHDHNVWAFFGIQAMAYIHMRDFATAVRIAREAIRKPHVKFWAYVWLVSALGHLGDTEGAAVALRELERRKPGVNLRFIRDTATWFRDAAQLELYLEGLKKAGMPE